MPMPGWSPICKDEGITNVHSVVMKYDMSVTTFFHKSWKLRPSSVMDGCNCYSTNDHQKVTCVHKVSPNSLQGDYPKIFIKNI